MTGVPGPLGGSRALRDAAAARVEVVGLSDAGYWGRPIADERYLVAGLS